MPNICHKFSSLKSRIALQVARKIAPCYRAFSHTQHVDRVDRVPRHSRRLRIVFPIKLINANVLGKIVILDLNNWAISEIANAGFGKNTIIVFTSVVISFFRSSIYHHLYFIRSIKSQMQLAVWQP